MRRPFTTPSQRAFTLIELMMVVAIIGVLAGLAVYSVRKYVQASLTSEAYSMLADIKAGQEAYKAETFQYLDVSGGGWNYYPKADPSDDKMQWGGTPDGIRDRWSILGVAPNSPVVFTYASVGGRADALPALPGGFDYGYPASADQAYIVVAVADLDGAGGDFTYVIGSSFTAEVATENRGK